MLASLDNTRWQFSKDLLQSHEKLNDSVGFIACRNNTFSNNNLKQWFSVRLYQSFTLFWRNINPPVLHSFFIEVCWHFFMHSSLKVWLQHNNVVEVWTLTGPLKHLHYFLFQSFCCKFAALLCLGSLFCCNDPNDPWPAAMIPVSVQL